MNDDHPLQFQVPACVYNFAPTLVPGGGAEVIPPTNLQWFANNGFDFSPDNHLLNDNQQQQPSSADQYEYESPPFNFADTDVSFPPPAPAIQPDLNMLSSLTVPSPYSLPVYSVSGFDILSILSRVHHRPNPTIQLGPVDLTTSFVVSDARRYDASIVYCSPNFTTLTGYEEKEIVGRNCRFLQAPGGRVEKGELRRFTSQDSANLLRKSLISGKDCQVSIVNYKKDGSAFINLVTIITLHGDDKEPLYHVGFQVDLTEQPNAILEKLQNGTYVANFEHRSLSDSSATQNNPQSGNVRDRRVNSIPPLVMSKDLKRLLDDPSFLKSFSLPTTTTTTGATPSTTAFTSEESVTDGSNQLVHLFLLDASPDFIHVVSLKGNFLYVAPSVRRVLGYESEEMMGTSIADYAHPEDVVPLMRELKESSATGVNASSSNNNNANEATASTSLPVMPRSVDLLFRAKTKMGRYVWVECRGRLYVEPGKGRKAIILSGRAREMMSLRWEDVNLAGGLAKSIRQGRGKENKEVRREVWGTLGGTSKDTATFMSVGQGVQEVLGWSSDELLGSALVDIILDDIVKMTVGGFIQSMRDHQNRRRAAIHGHEQAQLDDTRYKKVRCRLRKRDGNFVEVWLILYRADLDGEEEQAHIRGVRGVGMSISPAALVYQIRVADAETHACGPDSLPVALSSVSPSPVVGGNDQPMPPTLSLDLFEELSIARKSSWQYELQQLRNANTRLEEELAALEVAVEAADAPKAAPGLGPSLSRPATTDSSIAPADHLAMAMAPTPTTATNVQLQEKYQAHTPTYDDYPIGFHRPPPLQDLLSTGQLVVPEHAYVHGTGGGGVYESMGIQPFLYHPKPQYSSSSSPQGLISLEDRQHQRDRGISMMAGNHSAQVAHHHQHQGQGQHQHQPHHQTWGTMPPPSSSPLPPQQAPGVYSRLGHHSHPQIMQQGRRAVSGSSVEAMDSPYGGGSGEPQNVAGAGSSIGLKRSWSAIDSA